MKLSGLSEYIQGFDGKPIRVASPDGDQELPVTDVLLNCLGAMKVTSGKDSIRVFALGSALFSSENELEIVPADLELLTQAVDQNVPGYHPFIQGQVYKLLESV